MFSTGLVAKHLHCLLASEQTVSGGRGLMRDLSCEKTSAMPDWNKLLDAAGFPLAIIAVVLFLTFVFLDGALPAWLASLVDGP